MKTSINVITALCFLLLNSIYNDVECQEGTKSKWSISVDVAIQEHDKRMFSLPPYIAQRILERSPERFGTYQISVSVNSVIFDRHNFLSVALGISPSLELSTMDRPFLHSYGLPAGTFDIKHTNRYYKYLLQLPIRGRYSITTNMSITMDLMPQMQYHTVAKFVRDGTAKPSYTYSWWIFDLYSIEFNPGFMILMGNIELNLKYRAFQIKQLDEILFSKGTVISLDDRTNYGKYETYNPLKFWLSVGYRL